MKKVPILMFFLLTFTVCSTGGDCANPPKDSTCGWYCRYALEGKDVSGALILKDQGTYLVLDYPAYPDAVPSYEEYCKGVHVTNSTTRHYFVRDNCSCQVQ